MEHYEMNRQFEVTWRTLRTIAHSLMVHARVLEAYINLELMYTVDHIFPVLTIKEMTNKDEYPTTPFKMETGKKLQYHIYACYFVDVFYIKLLHLLGQRR